MFNGIKETPEVCKKRNAYAEVRRFFNGFNKSLNIEGTTSGIIEIAIPQLPSQRTSGFDIEIKYIKEDKTVEIHSKPFNPFMKEKRKIYSLPELRKSKIESEDLDDDDKMLTITDSASSFSITLNSDQASQVQYFIKRVIYDKS